MFEAIVSWLCHRKAQSQNKLSETEVTIALGNSEISDPQLLLYDENLLERSRTQWQFGDWQSLAQMQRETLKHHPDRAKLALLAAAGHQQLGNISAARQFTRLSHDWGCSKKLISEILIAGVHNTLGRAAAIAGRQQHALQHFETSVKIAMPGGESRLLVQARIREELGLLGLPASDILQRIDSDRNYLPGMDNTMQYIAEQQQQNAALSEQIKKQNADLTSMRESLENTIKKEMLNGAQQLEAFMGIQNFLNHGERLPGMHGWPISPDFALYLIELVDSNDYDLILEFGSGTSTVLIAKALARIGREHHGKPPTVQVAFEHLEQYHAQTLANLTQSGLADAVQLVLAPLEPFQAPNGNTYSYYSCYAKLARLAKEMSATGLKILMIVDGPPGSTGKHARYPAVPVVLAHFKSFKLDIVLDDYARNDEKETAKIWMSEIESVHPRVKLTAKKMEKDACLISVSSYNRVRDTNDAHNKGGMKDENAKPSNF